MICNLTHQYIQAEALMENKHKVFHGPVPLKILWNFNRAATQTNSSIIRWKMNAPYRR